MQQEVASLPHEARYHRPRKSSGRWLRWSPVLTPEVSPPDARLVPVPPELQTRWTKPGWTWPLLAMRPPTRTVSRPQEAFAVRRAIAIQRVFYTIWFDSMVMKMRPFVLPSL